MTGKLFDIADFATQDGPGIRTVLFFKGCPLRCAWCSNPESQNFHGEPMHHSEVCSLCGFCASVCSQKAITLGDKYCIDHNKCADCLEHKCINACPHEALKLVGQDWSVSELMAKILPQRAYYNNSGGGVTFSGGEALAQPDFALALAQAIKEEGIGLGLETCGFYQFTADTSRLKQFDFVFFDLKLMDEAMHIRFTGKSLKPILANLALWVKVLGSEAITLSIPLIPSINDNEAFFGAVANQASQLGIKQIRLLPYHELGVGKYAALSRKYPFTASYSVPDDTLVTAAIYFRSRNLTCEIVGREV